MKQVLVFLAAGCLSASASAQMDDPLASTLPNGKVVHFQTPDQKAKFDAARAAIANRTTAAQPAATPKPPAASSGAVSTPAAVAATTGTPRPVHSTALDGQSGPNGVVNTTAPAFTADYYMLAPASWAGKRLTLAVAYVTSLGGSPDPDGLVHLTAQTYNDRPGTGGDQDSGGRITLLVKPETINRLVQLCGTKYQYNGGWRIKVSMIHGEIVPLKSKEVDPMVTVREYGFAVTN